MYCSIILHNRPPPFKSYPTQSLSSSPGTKEVCRCFNRGSYPFAANSCPYTHTCPSCNSTLHGSSRCLEKKEDGKGKRRPQQLGVGKATLIS